MFWRATEPSSHLIQEHPTLEMVSVGLATQATSNSKRSFSMVLIMLSYLMSTGKIKIRFHSTLVKEWVEMAPVAKEASLSDKRYVNIWEKKVEQWEKWSYQPTPPKQLQQFSWIFLPNFSLSHPISRYIKMK